MGRVVLLTGGGRGLGRIMAHALAKEGHRLILSSRSEDTLIKTVEECRELGAGDVRYIVADLAPAGGAEELADAALQCFGQVDVLVNNAGMGINEVSPDYLTNPYRFWRSDRTVIERYLAVNTVAPMLLAIRLAKQMVERGWGRIVANSTSLDTMLRTSLYGASKSGLEAETAIMANDLIGTGVTANILVPGGGCGSRMTDEMGIPREAVLAPEIMGPPMAFLASNEADGINGRRIQARLWDASLPPAQAMAAAGDVIAWTGCGIQGQQPAITARSAPGRYQEQ
ncbi:SDR family oxidoreductase [Sandaracinobacter sp. RS1-74]|uniref:SDR family NAD(P)-dependent oxidoreductase n=1 Tax=Sandaracinobacteroides sayramensis TaxID=2913411 RepID=UPI001EDB7AF8|nr:SDR family oxidoreductase [Sandaracinobacteroides sayramensis]MCG2840934.1 SDR family oxidoreductase [Sandaracinobacteroides sayramensis]